MYFNPIIGLILTISRTVTSSAISNFNPIIGLILTFNDAMEYDSWKHFNPIIGLILTGVISVTVNRLVEFQSHYRSDFNLTFQRRYAPVLQISIPL